MAKRNITHIASLFQDFDLELKELEHLLNAAHASSRYLREVWREIMVSVMISHEEDA